MKNRPPLSIYIHIPFCIKKCRYCDFLSYPASDAEKQSYIDLLLSEIELQAPFFDNYKVISVFIGGGTPSILDENEIKKILCKLKADFCFENNSEITIESNPATVTAQKLDAYLDLGINRLSIGLQTADDAQLQMLGRVHNYRDFCDTYELARKRGFKNINIDLISAIPKQTPTSYRNTLEKVIAYEPEHISAYSLILEEGTWFYDHRDELELLSEDDDRSMYEMTNRLLSQHGYHRYEISNYAREGFECIHNKVYWQRGDYLGLGLGAASMVENVRWNNKRTIKEYETILQKCYSMQSFGPLRQSHSNLHTPYARMGENINCLTKEEQMEEFMFLGLRLMEGIKKAAFEKEFGIKIESVYGKVIEKLQKDGLIVMDDSIRLTSYGIDISNYVMAQFLL